MDPGSALSHNTVPNSFVVSRPEHVSRPDITPGHVARPEVVSTHVSRPEVAVGHVSRPEVGQLTAVEPVTNSQAPSQQQPAAVPVVAASDNFANFADFDTAAFDSLPPGITIILRVPNFIQQGVPYFILHCVHIFKTQGFPIFLIFMFHLFSC